MTRCTALFVIVTFCVAACSPAAPPQSNGAAAPPPNAAPTVSPATTPASTPAATPAAAAASAAEASRPTAAAPPAEAKPQFRAVTIPAGTALHVKLSGDVASDASKVEDAVRGELTQPIVVDDTTVVPAGATVRGTVLETTRSGRVEGRASLAIGFDRLTVGDETHTIRTTRISEEAKSTKRKDLKKVGVGAAAGAVVGAIAGGKKGAAVGSAVGAGAGGGVVAATRGDEVHLAAGTTVTTKLQDALTINVRIK